MKLAAFFNFFDKKTQKVIQITFNFKTFTESKAYPQISNLKNNVMKTLIPILSFLFITQLSFASKTDKGKDGNSGNDNNIEAVTSTSSTVTVTLENESIDPKEYHIEVTKTNGTPLIFKQVDNVNLNNTTTITDSLNLKAGTYILNVYEGNTKVLSQTFIKE